MSYNAHYNAYNIIRKKISAILATSPSSTATCSQIIKLTYGRYVRVVIRLVAEPVHQTCFADVRVAQHEHLVRFAGVHVTAQPSRHTLIGDGGGGVCVHVVVPYLRRWQSQSFDYRIGKRETSMSQSSVYMITYYPYTLSRCIRRKSSIVVLESPPTPPSAPYNGPYYIHRRLEPLSPPQTMTHPMNIDSVSATQSGPKVVHTL